MKFPDKDVGILRHWISFTQESRPPGVKARGDHVDVEDPRNDASRVCGELREGSEVIRVPASMNDEVDVENGEVMVSIHITAV